MLIIAREYNGSCLLMHFKSHKEFHRHLSSAHLQVDEYECIEVEDMNLDVQYRLTEGSNEPVKCALCTTQDCNSFLVVYQDDHVMTQIIIDSQLYDFKLFNQEYNISLFKEEQSIESIVENLTKPYFN